MILSILLNIIATTSATRCSISLNRDLDTWQPLLIRIKDTQIRFVGPVIGTDEIILRQEESIIAYCPGSFVLTDEYSEPITGTREKSIQLKCLGNSLKYGKKTVLPHLLSCYTSANNVAQYTGWECYRGNKEFEIGFRYNKTFLPVITGCFDQKQQTTLYTVHTIVKSIAGRQMTLPKRHNWVQGSFFNVTGVTSLYYKNYQRSLVNNLLGLEPNSTQYISTERQHYLHRGQLSPEEDFLYGSQRSTTYYLLNVIPRWQNIAQGNWQIVEDSLRRLAASRRRDLQIYSGGFRVLNFRHEHSGKFIKIYLSVQGVNRKVPVPEYIWKIAYDREMEAGIAFVGVNNPYVGGELVWHKLCKDICFKLGYIRLDSDYEKNGYVYCCEVNDLRRRVKTIPIFVVQKLLI